MAGEKPGQHFFTVARHFGTPSAVTSAGCPTEQPAEGDTSAAAQLLIFSNPVKNTPGISKCVPPKPYQTGLWVSNPMGQFGPVWASLGQFS